MLGRAGRSFIGALLLVPSAALTVPAADPVPETARGERIIHTYFRRQSQQIADACLADIKTKKD